MTNTPHPSPYTGTNPPRPETPDELRARIPGWGADLNSSDRPSVPKLQSVPTGAHWDVPEQQPQKWPRERSIEHAVLTPVFGTSCPPKGLSGKIRRLSYARYSEARAAHWLLLLGADRVDTVESTLRSFLTKRPDNVVAETGARAEVTHGGLSSRLGQKRADKVYLSINSVKTYIRTAYRTMGVQRRSQAVAWGLSNGFAPDHVRAVDPDGRHQRR